MLRSIAVRRKGVSSRRNTGRDAVAGERSNLMSHLGAKACEGRAAE
jgi:hypothetical protein